VTVPDDGLRSRQRQLAGDLRALILSGDIATGDRLPSTAELRLRYGVNNMTITRALALLKAEGLVEGHRGRAVVVTGRRPATIRAVHQPPVRAAARTASTRLLEVGETPAPAQVAAAFGLPAGTAVLVRSQLALLDDEPAELVWNYYPAELARGTALAEPRLLAGGSPAVLAALGHPVRAAVDHVSVRPATVAEFVALELPGDVPVLRQFRVAYADARRPVEATVMIKSGQRFEIRYDVPLTEENDSRDS
jgi:GntR family transcriptional regulator